MPMMYTGPLKMYLIQNGDPSVWPNITWIQFHLKEGHFLAFGKVTLKGKLHKAKASFDTPYPKVILET